MPEKGLFILLIICSDQQSGNVTKSLLSVTHIQARTYPALFHSTNALTDITYNVGIGTQSLLPEIQCGLTRLSDWARRLSPSSSSLRRRMGVLLRSIRPSTTLGHSIRPMFPSPTEPVEATLGEDRPACRAYSERNQDPLDGPPHLRGAYGQRDRRDSR